MALTATQWDVVNKATKDLREIGCAVCVFTPDDVESAIEAADDDGGDEAGIGEAAPAAKIDAADWLLENRRMIEEGMSTWGNRTIADNLPG